MTLRTTLTTVALAALTVVPLHAQDADDSETVERRFVGHYELVSYVTSVCSNSR